MNEALERTLSAELYLNDNYHFRRNVLNGKVEFTTNADANVPPDNTSGEVESDTSGDAAKAPVEAPQGWRTLTPEALNSIVRRAKKEQVCPKGSPRTEIVECNHAPRVLRDVWSREEYPLSWLDGKTTCTLSGIASPKGFENSLRRLGAKVVWCERYADHHRYDASEILYALNRTADMGADALVTTEKDAVRFPRFETTPVRCLYLRIAIEIISGRESFDQIINRICFRQRS